MDVSQVWDKKIAATNAHESQPLDYFLGMIDRQCLALGKAAGVTLAEGFLYLPLFGHPVEGEPLGG